MRPYVLEAVYVAHDRFGQIGEIAFSEISERQTAKPLRKRDARVFYLSVNKSVGIMILLQVRNKRQNDERGDKPKKIGTIPLVRFDNPAGMEMADMNRLKPTDEAGEARLVKNHDCFRQNNLEMSNVSIYRSATDMLRLNASMLASMQMLKLADNMYNKAINIREA